MARGKNSFGFWTAWFVVLGSMVGTGILTLSGPILSLTQSYGALLALWGVGGILALCGALTVAELASGIPQAGGDYVYVRQAFGKPVGFTYGWAMVVLGFAAPMALVGWTASNYFLSLFESEVFSPRNWQRTLLALLFILGFTLFHCRNHRSSSLLHNGTTFLNIALLLVFGIAVLGSPSSHWDHVTTGRSFFSVPLRSFGAALTLVMYAYTGWNGAAYLSGEVRSPRQTIPRSLLGGCLFTTFLYLLLNACYAVSFSVGEFLAFPLEDQNRIAFVTFQRLVGSFASRLFALGVGIGLLSALSAYILTGPRIVDAMARNGGFDLAKYKRSNGIPTFAILIQSLLASFFLVTRTFEQVLEFTSFGLGVIGLLVVGSVFVLRRQSGFKPGFRVPLYPLPPLLFLMVTLLGLFSTLQESPWSALLGLGILCLGFPLYLVTSRWKNGVLR